MNFKISNTMFDIYLLTCIIACIFSIPHLFFSYLEYSLSIGIFFSAVIVFLYSFKLINVFKVTKKIFIRIVCVFVLIFISACISFIFFNDFKPLLSFFLILFCVLTSYLFSIKLIYLGDNVVLQSLKNVNYIFLILGYFCLFFPSFFTLASVYQKYVFPFTEPSHYALSVGFLSLITGYFIKNIRIFLVFSLFLQGVLYPNLTLIIFSLLCFCIFFLNKKLLWTFIVSYFLLILSIVIFLSIDISKFTYFVERINFSKSNDNLTALVYMQGFDDALMSLKQTYGFGLGFQMAGTNEPSIYGEKIYDQVGKYLNRQDGGFLASKIVSEFGLLGLTIILSYLFYFFKYVRYLKYYEINQELKYPYFYLAMIGFFIEVFVRGIGYFSPQIYLILTLFFYNELYHEYSSKGKSR